MKKMIAPDKAPFSTKKDWYFSLFLHENICCGYSLEGPHWGIFYEYPQPMFSCRSKKNVMYTVITLLFRAMKTKCFGEKSLLALNQGLFLALFIWNIGMNMHFPYAYLHLFPGYSVSASDSAIQLSVPSHWHISEITTNKLSELALV